MSRLIYLRIMRPQDNKRLMRRIFEGLERGDGRPFLDSIAEDFTWTIIGSTPWSGTFEGREAVRRDLLDPLFAQFADRYTNTAQRFIADGDYVVVECRGRVRTTGGKPYNNTYCWVCRIADGKLADLTEYCDTELLVSALEPPGVSAA